MKISYAKSLFFIFFAVVVGLLYSNDSYAQGWQAHRGRSFVSPYVAIAIPLSPTEFRDYDRSIGIGVRWGHVGASSFHLRPSMSYMSFGLKKHAPVYWDDSFNVLSIGLAGVYEPVRDNNFSPYFGLGFNYCREERPLDLDNDIFSSRETGHHVGLEFLGGVNVIVIKRFVLFFENSYKNIFDKGNTGYFIVKIGGGILWGKRK